MIGKYSRNLRHLLKSVGDKKPIKLLFCKYGNINECSLMAVSFKDGKKTVCLFQNMGGERLSANYFNPSFEKTILELNKAYRYFVPVRCEEDIERFQNKCIILPENFDEIYSKFCNSNKKLLSQVFGRYFYDTDSVSKFLFCIIGDKPNLFVWAASNIYRHGVSMVTIEHIIQWNENYNKISSKLSKGSITSYNGRDKVNELVDELLRLRREKRSNDVINSFNTTQKKILKSIELDDKTINAMNRFSRLSQVKRLNFIRKMSTIEDPNDILKQMALVSNVHFEWNKDSFIEYLNNTDNIDADIVLDNGNIVLLTVKDYDSIKYLAKSTNWCISKNKKYWNDYVEYKRNATQYIIYDFSKKEDDNYSIIGFTVCNGNITNAHSFTNDNLMGRDSGVMGSLTSILRSNKDIFSILKGNDIPFDKIVNCENKNYEWSKESFIKYIEDNYSEDDYSFLNIEDNLVAVTFYNSNIRDIIGVGYDEEMGGDRLSCYNTIIFADFSLDKNDMNRLLWGIVAKDDYMCEESCKTLYTATGSMASFSFDSLLSKFNLPYDIICRTYSLKSVFVDAFRSFDVKIINDILSNKDSMSKIGTLTPNDISSIHNALHCSLFRYYSLDILNCFYNNGITLYDVIGRKTESLIEFNISMISDFYMRNYYRRGFIPTEKNYEQLFNHEIKDMDKATYILYFNILDMIISHESKKHANEISKRIICYMNDIPSERALINSFIKRVLPITDFSKIDNNTKSLSLQILRYSDEELFKEFISMKPCDHLINYILSNLSISDNSETFSKIMMAYSKKEDLAESFSFS